MKKTLLTIAIAILGAVSLQSQGKNDSMDPQVLQDLRENIFRTGVNTNPYEYLSTVETPVPKGFKPFYISHYGRHDSRSDWSGTTYPYTQEKFTLARQAGLLTPDGETSLERINEIIRLHDGMNGRLTRRGAREHRQIAGRMHKKFRRTVFADSLLGWRSYLYTPFACNLQAIFYRNKAGEVLVKFYLNEREATTLLLPGGPYYRWEDLKKVVS